MTDTTSLTFAGPTPVGPIFLLLFVDSPDASRAFYERLLGRAPFETSPTFAAFALRDGVVLGLWSRHTAEPSPSAGGGGAELALTVASADAVEDEHRRWLALGVPILQPPTDLDFGRTFVGADPDGHRLRVLTVPV